MLALRAVCVLWCEIQAPQSVLYKDSDLYIPPGPAWSVTYAPALGLAFGGLGLGILVGLGGIALRLWQRHLAALRARFPVPEVKLGAPVVSGRMQTKCTLLSLRRTRGESAL
jgi:hypothetical protein